MGRRRPGEQPCRHREDRNDDLVVAPFSGEIDDSARGGDGLLAAAVPDEADLADHLVRKGVPFRDAHEAVARAVREAERRGVDLAALPLDELRRYSPSIGADALDVLTLEGSVRSRDHAGGTAPSQVRAAIANARRELENR